MWRLLLLALSLLAAGFAAVHPAEAQSLTDAQRRQLHSLHHVAVVVPMMLPPGYHVAAVDVNRLPYQQVPGGGYWPESYSIRYSDGRNVIEFAGSNWSAGGDPGPESFARYFHSALFGTGVVSWGEGRYGPRCLLAYQVQRDSRGEPFLEYLMRYRGDVYSTQSCDTGLQPATFIRFIESAQPLR
jgi:hypothetical protein